ncbi:hypothetical protein GWN49_00325 [Candidatus Bathyarchaeota archaeon]|nr:hypothetical protein [Candidatus Bathyarchaeota archaeon]
MSKAEDKPKRNDVRYEFLFFQKKYVRDIRIGNSIKASKFIMIETSESKMLESAGT